MDSAAQVEKPIPLYDSYTTVIRLAYAVFAAAAALCLTQAMQPVFAGTHAYWPLWPVVILAARLWGPASAALAAIVGWLGVWYWFIPPNNSFAIENRADWVGIVGFISVAGLIIVSNLRENQMRRRVAGTARIICSTMQALLTAYTDASCACNERIRGHNVSCPAHWSVPVVIRTERCMQMLNGLADDVSTR